MALVVDTTVSYMGGSENDNVDFKLSKTLNQLTPEDIMSQEAYVGFTHFAVNSLAEGNLQSGIPENNPNHAFCYATDPYGFRWAGVSTKHWCYPANFAEGVYMRNILLYRPLNGGGANNYLNSNNRIVIDAIPRSDTSMQNLYLDDGSNYGPFVGILRSGVGENRLTDYHYISPAIMMIVNNQLFIWSQGLAAPYSQFFCDSLTSQGYIGGVASNFRNESYHSLGFGWTMGYTTGSMLDNVVQDDIYGNGHIENVNFNGHIGGLNLSFGSTNSHQRISESIIDNADKEFAKWFRAFTGFKFKVDNVWYKPIISGGIVTGYTDDMTVPSEWDSWTKASGHNVPSGGGGGGGSEENDKFESMTTGFSSAIGGITKYYKMSYSGLISLINDFNQHAPAGTTISNSIVSLYVNALVNSWTTFNTPIEIHTAGAQETPFTSVLEYPELYLFANPMEQLGYIDVPRVTNTFYDYNPYSTYELYVPFCGWIGLPDTIAGRRLRVELHMDIATMNCRALVRCEVDNGHGYDSTLCGEISGAIGAPCPLEVIEGGLYRQSFVNSALQLVSGGTMAIVGGMSGANALMASGAMNAIQGLANARMAGNTNYTQVVGRSGDCSGLAGAHKCYLKISHPVVDKVVETSLFGHSVGYICDIVDKLKNFKGFTVCLNPHITINATQTEKEEIKRLLEDGVIL